nr:DUF485 domain-containing protein [Stagnimonas aquatica]
MTMAATLHAPRDEASETPPLSADLQRIADSPAFHQLQKTRNSLAVRLSIAMCVIYYGFILMIAFGKQTLAMPLDGVITLGIPLGLGVILSAIVLTGIYVRRANTHFDRLTADAVRAAQNK